MICCTRKARARIHSCHDDVIDRSFSSPCAQHCQAAFACFAECWFHNCTVQPWRSYRPVASAQLRRETSFAPNIHRH